MDLLQFSRQSLVSRIGSDEAGARFLVKIFNNRFEVYAPLPDGFGVTVGSEYTAPFDVNGLSSGLGKAYAVAGFSQRIGMRMKKFYTNPEPSEISVEMEFTTEEDTRTDVMYPVFALTQMALGSTLDLATLSAKTQAFFISMNNKLRDAANTLGIDEPLDVGTGNGIALKNYENGAFAKGADGILRSIGFILTPEYVTVEFGNVMTWKRCYITSVATVFSNVLDYNGYPLSATCTITITPERYPIADDMINVYANRNRNRR